MREVKLKHSDLTEIGSDILSKGGTLHFRAYGSSMHPFICNGDALTIRQVDITRLKPGDVVLFKSNDGRIKVHRIIGKNIQREGVKFIMRGDSSLYNDGWISPEQILGKVDTVIRNRKDIRLDSRFLKLLTNLWIKTYPLGPIFLKAKLKSKQIASVQLRHLQKLKLYRIVSRKLIGKKISYSVEVVNDDPGLSRLYCFEKFINMTDPMQISKKVFGGLEGCGHIVTARFRSEIIGAAIITTVPDDKVLYPDWWIFGMLVRFRYRGAGIGERIMRRVMEKASEQGALRLNLLVFEKNKAAINLYRKMGFRQISIPELDKQLEEEAQKEKRQRIIMSRPIEAANIQ